MTIAFFQQDIAWEDKAANYRLVESTLSTLTAPVDIIVVPETFNTGFSDNMAAMAEPPMGDTYRFALRMARQYDALFVGTWTVLEEGWSITVCTGCAPTAVMDGTTRPTPSV